MKKRDCLVTCKGFLRRDVSIVYDDDLRRVLVFTMGACTDLMSCQEYIYCVAEAETAPKVLSILLQDECAAIRGRLMTGRLELPGVLDGTVFQYVLVKDAGVLTDDEFDEYLETPIPDIYPLKARGTLLELPVPGQDESGRERFRFRFQYDRDCAAVRGREFSCRAGKEVGEELQKIFLEHGWCELEIEGFVIGSGLSSPQFEKTVEVRSIRLVGEDG